METIKSDSISIISYTIWFLQRSLKLVTSSPCIK